MKKTALLAVFSLFLSATILAQVVVLQDGKTITYEPNANIVITGNTISRVLYEGILITIPKGQKVNIKKKDGKILVSGNNLKNVEISGKSIFSKGHAVIAVSPDDIKVTPIKGDTTITANGFSNRNKDEDKSEKEDKSKNKKYLKQYYNAEDNTQENTEDLSEMSDYVNEVAVQQSEQDVIYKSDLSQSSPRS